MRAGRQACDPALARWTNALDKRTWQIAPTHSSCYVPEVADELVYLPVIPDADPEVANQVLHCGAFFRLPCPHFTPSFFPPHARALSLLLAFLQLICRCLPPPPNASTPPPLGVLVSACARAAWQKQEEEAPSTNILTRVFDNGHQVRILPRSNAYHPPSLLGARTRESLAPPHLALTPRRHGSACQCLATSKQMCMLSCS